MSGPFVFARPRKAGVAARLECRACGQGLHCYRRIRCCGASIVKQASPVASAPGVWLDSWKSRGAYATPLAEYATHDNSAALRSYPCHCGRGEPNGPGHPCESGAHLRTGFSTTPDPPSTQSQPEAGELWITLPRSRQPCAWRRLSQGGRACSTRSSTPFLLLPRGWPGRARATHRVPACRRRRRGFGRS